MNKPRLHWIWNYCVPKISLEVLYQMNSLAEYLDFCGLEEHKNLFKMHKEKDIRGKNLEHFLLNEVWLLNQSVCVCVEN